MADIIWSAPNMDLITVCCSPIGSGWIGYRGFVSALSAFKVTTKITQFQFQPKFQKLWNIVDLWNIDETDCDESLLTLN